MAAQRALDLELLRAAERSDVSEVARLLEAGAAINALQEDGTDADGRTVWNNLQYHAIQSELCSCSCGLPSALQCFENYSEV
jgi:hypothetical protein